jgi:hypothetical protein
LWQWGQKHLSLIIQNSGEQKVRSPWGGVHPKSGCDTEFLDGFLQLVQIFHGLTFKLKEFLHFQECENKAMYENTRFTHMPLQEIGCIPFSELKKKNPYNAMYVNDPKLIFSMCPCCFDLLNFKNMPIVLF